jgi:hypothetical protein
MARFPQRCGECRGGDPDATVETLAQQVNALGSVLRAAIPVAGLNFEGSSP